MTIENIITAIPGATLDRYEIALFEGFVQEIFALRPQTVEKSHVMRIKRKYTSAAAWRTILIVDINDTNGLSEGLKWAAAVRDELLNGESADLYLFIITENSEQFNIEMCINIEAGDQYCRKYITRPDETISDFMNRTFLCKFESRERLQSVTDPLKLALIRTKETFPQFDENEQERWREAFLSGKGSLELADILFSEELKVD